LARSWCRYTSSVTVVPLWPTSCEICSSGTPAGSDPLVELQHVALGIFDAHEPEAITTITQRIEGFTQAMTEAGMPVTGRTVLRIPTRRFDQLALPWQADGAYQVAQDLVAGLDRPDAFVVGNDYFALGLYRALAERKITIPTDVRIVGFGDYPFAGFLAPPLSTVRLPAAEVGTRAVDLLLDRVADPDRPAVRALLPPTMIVRESA
jgi:LacI family transcriptional regulator